MAPPVAAGYGDDTGRNPGGDQMVNEVQYICNSFLMPLHSV